MAAPRKYPDELREWAARLAVEARRDPASASAELVKVNETSGC
jgi:transposase